jgi:3-oxoadipate enol-lactonase
MPFVDLQDHKIHYTLSGPRDAPVLVLSNSLGTNLSMWDPQLAEFEEHFSVLRYDTRGHGASAVTTGPYTFDQLGRDVVALLDELKIETAYFCGLSMGGMTGMWLGVHAASRMRKLILCSTSAKFGNAEMWDKRMAAVRQRGMRGIAPVVLERWYTPGFLANAPAAAQTTSRMLESTSLDGYLACCAALRDADFREDVKQIRTPTLIISGAKDASAPPADGRYLFSAIPGAQYVELDAAHISNIELPEDFTREVMRFLGPKGN